jgi:pimeloyl-ACP methyl ester carboxylesterase
MGDRHDAAMERFSLGNVDLAYEMTGDGDPVLLIHGGGIADTMATLAPPLVAAGHRVVWYHRRGYGHSTGEAHLSVASHAADAIALVEHLNLGPAHIVGHCFGGTIALQMALDAPELVRSLVLEEAAPNLLRLDSAETLLAGMSVITDQFAAGDPEGAVVTFIEAIFGVAGVRPVRDLLGETTFRQFTRDASSALIGDLGGLLAFEFGAAEGARINAPAIFIGGGDTDAPIKAFLRSRGLEPPAEVMGALAALFQQWMPKMELVVLPGVTHAMHMQFLEPVVDVVVPFLARQRVTV